MIEVFIVKNGEPLGHIEIVNRTPESADNADYSVRFGIDRGSAVGVHSRMMHAFPRKQYNVFGLVRLALDTLRESEFELEHDYDPDSDEAAVPAALARRLRRTVQEIQGGFSRLHNH